MTKEQGARMFSAEGKVLGRLATEVARVLRGKDQPTWVPNRDDGPTVVVTNTDRVRTTGTKRRTKLYHYHTQHKPGAYRIRTLAQRMERDSREVLRDAVWNMLPKNRLRHRMITHLKLYRGEAPQSVSTHSSRLGGTKLGTPASTHSSRLGGTRGDPVPTQLPSSS